MISIIAPNIKQGGGLALLNYLLEHLGETPSSNVTAYCDSKASKEIKCSQTTKIVPVSGIFAKINLFAMRGLNNAIYFGNLPPIFKSSKSIVYIHNPYLVCSYRRLFQSGLSVFIKYFLQRMYIKAFIHNVDHVCFQTSMMRHLFSKYFNHNSLQLVPFFKLERSDFVGPPKFTFCYISLPSPHKNHNFLLDAIEISLNDGCSYKIAVTVPFDNIEICARISSINDLHGEVIYNFGKINQSECIRLYGMSRCLIFPSSQETLGLPLVEATYNYLNVIAPKLEYVNEVIAKNVSYEANSLESLVHRIKEYVNHAPDEIQVVLINDSIKQVVDFVS